VVLGIFALQAPVQVDVATNKNGAINGAWQKLWKVRF
jgi:hypothetical protein